MLREKYRFSERDRPMWWVGCEETLDKYGYVPVTTVPTFLVQFVRNEKRLCNLRRRSAKREPLRMWFMFVFDDGKYLMIEHFVQLNLLLWFDAQNGSHWWPYKPVRSR